ncbi:MAG: hypothetical protein JXB07_15010 [Anaerolineae bacterium]|nr:hypothetical protein [Anaerolineae bacterium]
MTRTTQETIARLVPLTLLIATLACNMPTARLGGPDRPAQAVAPSTESLNSFNDKWRDLNLNTPAGPFSITFTEAELSSALADAIQQAEADKGEPLPIGNTSVVLTNGTLNIYGQLNTSAFQSNGLIVATPAIGEDGLLHVSITSVEFGPIEIDPVLLGDLVSSVERRINAPIQSSPFHITLTTIAIADGLMTVEGAIAP